MSSKKSLQEELGEIGLTKQESIIYLSCLHNPKTTPSKLSKETGIARTSIYPIIQKLLDKHFLYQKTFSKKKYLFPYPPSKALDTATHAAQVQADCIARVAERLSERLKESEKQLPLSADTGASFLYGKQGVRDLVQRVLEEKEDIYWLGPSNIFLDLNKEQQRELFQRLSVKRMDENTTAFAITDNNFMTSSYFHGGSETFRQLRIVTIPQEITSMVFATGDLCGLVKSLGNKSEVLILRNREYAHIMRFALHTLWQHLKEV